VEHYFVELPIGRYAEWSDAGRLRWGKFLDSEGGLPPAPGLL
jgi:hypothetical protein